MIISQARVGQLLEIFNEPKNIKSIDIFHEKQEMENASKFIKDYHLYGPPQTYNQNSSTINESIPLTKTYTNNGMDEIHQSIFNIKKGHQDYVKEKEKKNLNKDVYISNINYPKYDPTYQSYTQYEYQKNENIYNSILKNPNNSTSIYYPNYPYNYKQNANNYPYNSYSINGTQFIQINKLQRLPRLKDIKANPEDVMITEIPSNLAVSINPLTCSNLGVSNMPLINNTQNITNEMPQTLSQKPPVIEEINTDVIPTDISNQNFQQNEEMVVVENPEPEPEPVQTTGKYQITDFNGPITLPPNYSTDDEDEFYAIQILNQDKSTWKLQIDKDNIKVYSKLYKIKNDEGKEVDNIMFFTEALVNFPASEVNKQLHTYSLREKWEPSLKKGKLIKEEDLPNNMHITDYYSYIKMPFVFSDRDLVLRKKIWFDYQGEKDCTLNRTYSITHPDFPPKEKPVRADFENRGEYVKPIDATKCKLFICSKFDMKLSAPASMMEGKGSEGQAKWVKEFIKQCGK